VSTSLPLVVIAPNIATPCGLKFFVVDVDVKKERGDLTLEELERKHRRLPDTLQQITGSEVDGVKGRHYFFALPDGLTIRSRARVPGPGLDIRGQGGYIILEPSIHPTTKRKYIFDGADEIESQMILAAPEWLINELVNTPHRRFELPQELPEGCRNDQMFKAACLWRNSGMHQPEILAGLRAINETRTASNPLPDAELIAISESCCRYEPKQIMPDTAYKLLREYEAQRATPVQENPLYRDRYVKNRSGKPISCLANVVIALEQAPHWYASLAYDEFGLTVRAMRELCGGRIKPGHEIQDYQISLITAEMQQVDELSVSSALVGEGIVTAAKSNSSHPLQNYLKGLKWVGKHWLISPVARRWMPDAKPMHA